jgi:hypothetical protein
MKYSKLTNRFAKTFLNIMDRHNYGVWYPGKPTPAFEHPTDFLEKIINYDFKWTSQYQFPKKEFEKHFAEGLPRFCHTTRRSSDVALLRPIPKGGSKTSGLAANKKTEQSTQGKEENPFTNIMNIQMNTPLLLLSTSRLLLITRNENHIVSFE